MWSKVISRADAARSLDINANMLGRWVKENDCKDGQAFRGNGKLTPEQEEIRTLKTQVKRLQMEKDILKNYPRAAEHPAPVGKQTLTGVDWC